MSSRGGGKASGGASVGTRLVVFTAAAGALGYVVVYFFDPELGEERRRRVIEAAHAAINEMVLLSQRLVAAPPNSPRERAPEPAPAPEPDVEWAPAPDPDSAPEPDMAGTLHEKVTFFRLGEDEPAADELPVLAPVAVIAEELPVAAEPRLYEPAPAPTIIAYDAAPEPEPLPEPEPEPEAPHTGRTLLAAAAVVAALIAAAALGVWAISSGGGSKTAARVPTGAAQAISLISQPGARKIPVGGSNGRMLLYVTRSGRGVLILLNFKAAPQGKEYQAWIVTDKTPHSAGLFKGGGRQLVIPLQQRLPKDAVFAVTVERTGGAPAPTQKPVLAATIS